VRETLHFLEQHGYALVFGIVMLEQIGAPIPAVPVLLAAGALAGAGKFSLALVIALATLASLLSDAVWYRLGQRKGPSILRLLCRISLEPDSCVGSTKTWFQRLGATALLIAKFVPGLSTAAPPMAGATRMPAWKFALYDTAGSAIWSGAFASLGFAFSRQLEPVVEAASRVGSGVGLTLAGGLVLYVALKYWQRRRFIRSLRSARISPEELREQMQSSEPLAIIDLRHAMELGEEALVIPGAVWFDHTQLEHRHSEIPRDRDIVLYCS
jgi:membrane protein DedA with SNARE-associated domain